MEDLPADLMSQWLKTRITGCMFALALARKEASADFRYATVTAKPDAVPDYVHTTLTEAAKAPAAILFIFPSLRYDEEIADLLTSLTTIPAFKLYRQKWPKGAREELLVLLEWATPFGGFSRTMGLGPSGAMPITRRAPFVSLLAWPGSHNNPFRQDAETLSQRQVGVSDINHTFKKEIYDKYWEASQNNKKERDHEELDGSASLRYVTFCLHQRVLDRLNFSTR